MKVSEIMSGEVYAIDEREPVIAAARLLKSMNLGALPVTGRGGALVGMLNRPGHSPALRCGGGRRAGGARGRHHEPRRPHRLAGRRRRRGRAEYAPRPGAPPAGGGGRAHRGYALPGRPRRPLRHGGRRGPRRHLRLRAPPGPRGRIGPRPGRPRHLGGAAFSAQIFRGFFKKSSLQSREAVLL